MITVKEIAKMIDHSILHPTMTDEDLKRECEVAKKHDVASVCVKPYAVKLARSILKGTDVEVGCVIGFPHGNSSIAVKVFETQQACRDGASEIDMVINIPKTAEKVELDSDYIIRRKAVDLNIPLFTNVQATKRFIKALQQFTIESLPIKSWDEYQ